MTSDLIRDRGRGPELLGTRITVYDLLIHFLQPADTEAFICKLYDLTPEQVAAARAYILNNLETVLAGHLKIEARIAAGNPPEVIEQAEKTHETFSRFKEWIDHREKSTAEENAGESTSMSGRAGVAFRRSASGSLKKSRGRWKVRDMRGLLADVNVAAHAQSLRGLFDSLGLAAILSKMDLVVCTFSDLGIAPDADDRFLWNYCQENGWVFFTDNRNDDGADSLKATLDEMLASGLLASRDAGQKGPLPERQHVPQPDRRRRSRTALRRLTRRIPHPPADLCAVFLTFAAYPF